MLEGIPKQFRSCIMEYRIKASSSKGHYQFLLPVIVNIRHSVSNEPAMEALRVFCIEDDGQVKEIFKQALSSYEPWFELSKNFVRIYTYHFCLFTCVCNAKEFQKRNIQYFIATLYGKITQVPRDFHYAADLTFALWVHTTDGVENLPEFREV